MALTRIHSDLCTISDRDARNEEIYDYRLSNVSDYRRGNPLYSQIYTSQRGGLEKDFDLETKLRGQYRVANNCNVYGAGPQADILANAPDYEKVCMGYALAPEYTRLSRVARHYDRYQSGRAKIADWHFYTPPVEFPSFGVYRFNRHTDTRQIAKDRSHTNLTQCLKHFYPESHI